MRDLAFLRASLPTPPTGLDSVDPALAELSTLAAKEQLAELEARIEALFDGGVYDARAVSYYLWVSWMRGGVPVLTEVLTTLGVLVSANLASLGPVEKREALFAKALAWLAQKIGDGIQYHETKRTPQWQGWAKVVTPTMLDEAHAALGALQAALGEGWTVARTPLAGLSSRLGTLRDAVARQAGAGAASASLVRGGRGDAVADRPTTSRDDGDSHPGTRLTRVEIGVSPAYLELVDKLHAFGRLVDKGDLVKASVVADDVMNIIEHFDPRAYFPAMFAEFSEKLSGQVESLSPLWEQRDSVAWKAMVQFYRVDLRRFVGE